MIRKRSAMPHKTANIRYEKLHQRGERVGLFLCGSVGSRKVR
jgi:hypothetical protein